MSTRAIRDGEDDLWVELGPDRFYCFHVEAVDPREAELAIKLENAVKAQGLVPATETEIFLETDEVKFV